jgi:hypothetical protein
MVSLYQQLSIQAVEEWDVRMLTSIVLMELEDGIAIYLETVLIQQDIHWLRFRGRGQDAQQDRVVPVPCG